MDAFVERIAETMDETDGTETSVFGGIGATLDQLLLNPQQQDMQNHTLLTAAGWVLRGTTRRRIPSEAVADRVRTSKRAACVRA